MNSQHSSFFGKSPASAIAGLLTGLIALANPPVEAAAARASVIGWWPLNGDAADATRHGLNGSLVGGAAFDAEKPASLTGQSIRFGADADGVLVPANSALNTDEFTLGYFINLEGTTQGNAGLERLTARTGYAFETAAGGAGGVGGTSSSTGVTLSYYSPPTGWQVTNVELPADGWVHVAWHNSADAMEVYLNGELAYTGPAVPPGTLRGIMTFGTRFDQVEGFAGLMDDIFLADNSVTAEDIAEIAKEGVDGYFGFTKDSDSDGLPDWWEVENGLDANDSIGANGAAGDGDNDGLTNAQEFARGTKANDNDSDDDGIHDGAEVTGGTNPAVADTDGDGLSDGDEITAGTDPLKADTDGDTVLDGDEVRLGTNPLDPLSGPPASAFLVLQLKLDGDTQDSSPAANHGVVRGSPEFVADSAVKPGQALAFTSNDMGVEIAGTEALGANRFTLAYWVKPTALQEGAYDRLTSRAGYGFETGVGNGGAGPLTLSYYQTTGWFNTGVGLPLNEFTHVVFRNRGSGPQDMDVFINGKLVYTGMGAPAAGPGNGLMSVGNAFNGVEGFEGIMDEVRLYRAPIGDADIAALAVPSDTDADGLPDWWETANNLNPADSGTTDVVNGAAGDPDNDTLTNAQEFARRTNPRLADTDGDGLSDGAEVTRGTNPLLADTDGDGLNDQDEVTRGTNPLLADTDGDGYSDAIEVQYNKNPLDPLSAPSPSDFLVLHLDLDGDTEDDSGLLNNGSLLGSPEFVNDTPLGSGQSLSLTSNDMGVTIADSDSLSASQFTLAYWAKPTTLQEGAGLERLTSRAGDSFETAIGNAAGIGATADLTLSYFQGAWRKTGVTLPLNEWSHVTWRNRGPGAQDMDLYVNGQLVFTGPGVASPRPGNGLMNIGTRHNGVEGFEGMMDDIRLYSAPLRDADILSLSGAITITQVTRAANGAVTLAFTSQPSRTYSVERATNLGAAWDKLTETLASGGASTTYTDNSAANLQRAFYRIKALAQ